MPRSVIFVCAFFDIYFLNYFFIIHLNDLRAPSMSDVTFVLLRRTLAAAQQQPGFCQLLAPWDVTSVEIVNLDTSKSPQPIQPLAHIH